MSETTNVRIPENGEVAETFVDDVAERHPLRPSWGRNAWTANLAGAAGTVLLGVYVVVSAIGFGLGAPERPGAGVFPLAIGSVFVLLGSIWLVQCVVGRVSHVPTAPREKGVALKVALTVAAIVGFALALAPLGYQLTMFLAMAVLLTFVARTRWWLTLILSAAMSFGSYALFELALGVHLPLAGIPLLRQIGL